jgi:methylmalonyl-CoA mutase cobalamin-binding subunit
MMLFRRGNRKKSTHRTPLIWRLRAIQERVTAVLLSIPKEAFADSFQKLYERCQQCAVKNGDYFEGK